MLDVRKIERVVGYLFLVLGFLFLLFPLVNAKLFFYTIAILFSLSALSFLYKAFKSRKLMDLVLGATLVLVSVFLWSHEFLERTLLVYVFSAYMLINGLMYLIQLYFDFKEKSKNTFFHFFLVVVYIGLAVFSFISASRDVRVIMYYFAFYFLLMAFEMLDRGYSVFDIRTGRDFLMRYWLAMPVYFAFLVPSLFLRKMEEQIKIGENVPFEERKNDKPVNLKVYVHTGLTGEKIAGHMTISSNDIMYSYGNYDAAKEKLFRTVGPGVFFTVPAKPYVNNSCIFEGSTLFEYGLSLTQEQLDKFYQIVNDMHNRSYRWLCPIEEKAEGRKDFKEYEKDYASRLSYRTGAKFREFTSGQWKNYWLFGENCSVFAEYVLKEIGLDILPKVGIVAPGDYFIYMEKAYSDPDSPVVYKSWHSAKYPQSLYQTIA